MHRHHDFLAFALFSLAVTGCGVDATPAEDSPPVESSSSELRNPGHWKKILVCGTYSSSEYAAWVDVDTDPATNMEGKRLQLVIADRNIRDYLGIELVYAYNIDATSSARWMPGPAVQAPADFRALVGSSGFLQVAVARRSGRGMKIDIESSDAGCRLACDGEFDSGGGCTTGWREVCPSEIKNWWFNDCRERN